MATQKLTDPFIRNLDNPEKRLDIYDSLVKGLAIRITKNGVKTFVYRYRFAGKTKRYTIGRFPKVRLSQARELVKELSHKVSSGVDPAVQVKKKIKDSEYTINDLAAYFKKRYLPLKKASTQSSYKSRIDAHIIPELGPVPVKVLSRGHIIELLEEIAFEDGNPINSNRIRAVLSSMLSFAVQKDLLEYNPVKSVKKLSPEKTRKRFYTDDEVKILWSAFEAERQPNQGLLKMILLNGQRKTETRKMKWADITDGIWTIPGEDTKNGLPHSLPLSDLSQQILEDMAAYSGGDAYVFKAQQKETGPVPWVSDIPKRIRKASEIPDFRYHDLRRTVGTNITRLGFSRVIAGKVLNHAQLSGDSQVTAVYDRYAYMEEKREALQGWADHIKSLVQNES